MNSYEEIIEQFGLGMTGYDLASNLWSIISGIIAYVFMAIGMYTIAKRRGINHPWLAWIPFGGTWLLGCISDQYRYVTRGEEKSKRKVMLGFEIATSAVGIVNIVLLVTSIIGLLKQFGSEIVTNETEYMTQVLSPLMIAMVLCFVMLGLAIALAVLAWIAVYDLFKSCNPEYATVFLVLSIIFGGIVQGIFVFANRNKDLGMPPRHSAPLNTQPMYSQPTWQPAQPPVWQPQQPPVEPWEQNNEHF